MLHPKEFQQTKSGGVTGPIWLRHEGVDFPKRGWSDFPVIVTGWWLKHLASLTRESKDAVCSFMDGPFEFGVYAEGLGQWRLQFIERRANARAVVSEFIVPSTELQATLQTAAATILAECDRQAWTGSDIEVLRSISSIGRH
jgi:hypothetical protein